MGEDRRTYLTHLFPMVALGISAMVVEYHWTLISASGVVLILFGNYLIFKRPNGTINSNRQI